MSKPLTSPPLLGSAAGSASSPPSDLRADSPLTVSVEGVSAARPIITTASDCPYGARDVRAACEARQAAQAWARTNGLPACVWRREWSTGLDGSSTYIGLPATVEPPAGFVLANAIGADGRQLFGATREQLLAKTRRAA